MKLLLRTGLAAVLVLMLGFGAMLTPGGLASPARPVEQPRVVNQSIPDWMPAEIASSFAIGIDVLVPFTLPSPFSGMPQYSASDGYYSLYWYVGGGSPTLLQVSRTVPIVFAQSVDPVGNGFVASLARPGGNVTGFTQFEYSLSGKWLELLREVAPQVRRVGVIRDPLATGPVGIGQWAVIQAFASPLGVELTPIDISVVGDTDRLLEAFLKDSTQDGDEEERDRYLMPFQEGGQKRIFEHVRGGVGGGEGNRHDEVGGDEPQEHQHEELALPPGEQALQHSDRAFATRTFNSHPPVDG